MTKRKIRQNIILRCKNRCFFSEWAKRVGNIKLEEYSIKCQGNANENVLMNTQSKCNVTASMFDNNCVKHEPERNGKYRHFSAAWAFPLGSVLVSTGEIKLPR